MEIDSRKQMAGIVSQDESTSDFYNEAKTLQPNLSNLLSRTNAKIEHDDDLLADLSPADFVKISRLLVI